MLDRVQSSEYGVRRTEDGKMAVQRCKSAYGLCKGGKVDDNQSTEYGVQSTEYRVRRNRGIKR